jgi:hypothetical protein
MSLKMNGIRKPMYQVDWNLYIVSDNAHISFPAAI